MTTSEQAALLAKHHVIEDDGSVHAALYAGDCVECDSPLPCDVHRMAELKDAEIAEARRKIEKMPNFIGSRPNLPMVYLNEVLDIIDNEVSSLQSQPNTEGVKDGEIAEMRDEIERLTKDVGYLRGRVREIVTDLDHTALVSMESWPKGANGPIAIAVYESMAQRQRTTVHMLRAALMRTEDQNLVTTDPEASQRVMRIIDERTDTEGGEDGQ